MEFGSSSLYPKGNADIPFFGRVSYAVIGIVIMVTLVLVFVVYYRWKKERFTIPQNHDSLYLPDLYYSGWNYDRGFSNQAFGEYEGDIPQRLPQRFAPTVQAYKRENYRNRDNFENKVAGIRYEDYTQCNANQCYNEYASESFANHPFDGQPATSTPRYARRFLQNMDLLEGYELGINTESNILNNGGRNISQWLH